MSTRQGANESSSNNSASIVLTNILSEALFDEQKQKDLPYLGVVKDSLGKVLRGLLMESTVLLLADDNYYGIDQLIEWGASSVVAVAAATEMLEKAIKETENFTKVNLRVGDMKRDLKQQQCLSPNEKFDVVVSLWTLNNAKDEEELLTIWQNIDAHLKDNGSFVGLVLNPEIDFKNGQKVSYSTCGVRATRDSWPMWVRSKFNVMISLEFGTESKKTRYEPYHLKKRQYETAAQRAGMESLAWLSMTKGKDDGSGVFDEYLKTPLDVICVAVPAKTLARRR